MTIHMTILTPPHILTAFRVTLSTTVARSMRRAVKTTSVQQAQHAMHLRGTTVTTIRAVGGAWSVEATMSMEATAADIVPVKLLVMVRAPPLCIPFRQIRDVFYGATMHASCDGFLC